MKRCSAQAVSVDERGFVVVDGVKIGRRVVKDGAVKLQLCDKDRRRSAERGTRLVEVTAEELGEALEASLPLPPPARGDGIHESETAVKRIEIDYWAIKPREEGNGA